MGHQKAAAYFACSVHGEPRDRRFHGGQLPPPSSSRQPPAASSGGKEGGCKNDVLLSSVSLRNKRRKGQPLCIVSWAEAEPNSSVDPKTLELFLTGLISKSFYLLSTF